MPSCLVNHCLSKSGRKGQSEEIILHKFPTDVPRIRAWLQQTGQQFMNIDLLAERIAEGQKQKKYFLCSCHFTRDQYIYNPSKRVLRSDAIPSIFPEVLIGESIIEETLKKIHRRGRQKMPESMGQPRATVHTVVIKEEPEWEPEKDFSVPGFCSTGTQTDFNLCNSVVSLKETQLNVNCNNRFPNTVYTGTLPNFSISLVPCRPQHSIVDVNQEYFIVTTENKGPM